MSKTYWPFTLPVLLAESVESRYLAMRASCLKIDTNKHIRAGIDNKGAKRAQLEKQAPSLGFY